ncbi:MAG: sigma-70 family RNA polymerase sigma factor [Bacteroides sp.]|nr:sigma-70 family RNA polymerase sigma factor [Bacteroides sp.]
MDAEIFKRKFLPYHKRLYYIAYRLLENEADAQDIVQEAYLKMWNKREGLTMISNPEAFSVTLVRNICFDLLRSGKYLLQRQCVELAAIHEQPQSDRSEEKEQARMIRQLIATLPEQQQQIITLRDIRECSYEEIEKITGLSAVNIRVILSRARKKIREQFNRKELS